MANPDGIRRPQLQASPRSLQQGLIPFPVTAPIASWSSVPISRSSIANLFPFDPLLRFPCSGALHAAAARIKEAVTRLRLRGRMRGSKGARLFKREARSKGRAMPNYARAASAYRVRNRTDHKSRSGKRTFIVKRQRQQFIEPHQRGHQIKNLRQGIAGGFGG